MGSGANANPAINQLANGSTYAIGHFSNTINIGGQQHQAKGLRDTYVAKFTDSGSIQWLTVIGENNAEISGTAIVADNQGNSYITGNFKGRIFAGGQTLESNTPAAFVIKLTDKGSINWTNSISTSRGEVAVYGIAIDAYDTIYITGSFNGEIYFGNMPATSQGQSDIFIASLSDQGYPLWIKRAGSTLSSVGSRITIDIRNDIYIVGSFEGTASFDNIQITSAGQSDAFVAKLKPDQSPVYAGDFEWVKSLGGTQADFATDIAINNSGIHVLGVFADTASHKTPKTSVQIKSAGLTDLFLLKLDFNGDLQWLQQAGGSGADTAHSLRTDKAGNVYIAGRFENTAQFGPITLISAGKGDVFVAKLVPSGYFDWVKRGGGSGDDGCCTGSQIAVNPDGSQIIFAGLFQDTATFDTHTLKASGANSLIFWKLLLPP
jgi:hypothetical protein